jgi:hypothetical protein
MPNEEEMRKVEEIDRRARIRRLQTVIILQLPGDLEHSRASVDKSIIGDKNGNLKFNNGQLSVFDTFTEATDDETINFKSFFISPAGGTKKT